MSKKSGLCKFLLGAGVGFGLGILFAPKSGKETRQELKEKMDDLLEKVKNIDIEDVKVNIQTKVLEIKDDLKNLDKETVVDAAKKQAKKIKKKADELVDYAVEKGTPVIENAAREVKKSTVKVLEAAADKLNTAEPKKVTPKKTTKASK